MSTINVNNLSGKGGATPNLPDGAVISGVATVTNLKPTNVNVSGAVTATTFDGSLKSTGTPTLGLGVTINASGVHISGVTTVGVVTGGTFYGDGSNLTGVGETIAPWHYNPDVNDASAPRATGIGITFNKKVVAGSGTATLKIVNAGAAGTTIQSWGVSSCTFATTVFTLGALVSDLTAEQTYQVDIPGTFIDDAGENSYVGTAWTFAADPTNQKMYGWGKNAKGELGLNSNNPDGYSSPVQIPGTSWAYSAAQPAADQNIRLFTRLDGTLWASGNNTYGKLGQNNQVNYSSPVQIGSGTDWAYTRENAIAVAEHNGAAIKQDGTLWIWGRNQYGQLGQTQGDAAGARSSPVQIPGTTWSVISSGDIAFHAIKTDGTMWCWGQNADGALGLNQPVSTKYSSPVQIPGTTWSKISKLNWQSMGAVKTDGTLWVWGHATEGMMGENQPPNILRSSPIQIPGTNWAMTTGSGRRLRFATKTDGTLWGWGYNGEGDLGVNDVANRSSPIQIPGTTWKDIAPNAPGAISAVKTDGTLWAWGNNDYGQYGNNTVGNPTMKSSPVQVGSETTWYNISGGAQNMIAITQE